MIMRVKTELWEKIKVNNLNKKRAKQSKRLFNKEMIMTVYLLSKKSK